MTDLELKHCFIENIKCEFPKFPVRDAKKSSERIRTKERFRVVGSLYPSKSDKNKFAFKLKVSFNAIKTRNREKAFVFEGMIVGLFKKTGGDKSIKFLANSEAKDILYEKLTTYFTRILNNAPIKGVQIPPKIK
jgi:preprotein translocase subunit SecB